MNGENTKGKIEFITDHIWRMFVAWFWYKNILFRCIGYHSLKKSRLILLGVQILCTVGKFIRGIVHI